MPQSHTEIENAFVNAAISWNSVERGIAASGWQAFEVDLASGTIVLVMERVDENIRFVYVGQPVYNKQEDVVLITPCSVEQRREALNRAWFGKRNEQPTSPARERIVYGLRQLGSAGEVRRAFGDRPEDVRYELARRRIVAVLKELPRKS